MKNKIINQRTYERPMTYREKTEGIPIRNYTHKKHQKGSIVKVTECPQANPDVLSNEIENLYWKPRSSSYQRELFAQSSKDAFILLTEKQRRVMELMVYSNLSFSQVARVLGVSKSTVRDIKEAAAEKIKKYVEIDLKKYPKSIFE